MSCALSSRLLTRYLRPSGGWGIGGRRSPGLICGTFVLLVVVAVGGCSALEGAGTTASRAELVVLFDVTGSAVGTQPEQRRHLTDVVLPLAERRKAEVVLATIDDDARAHPRIVGRVSFDTAAAEGNGVAAGRIVAAGRRAVLRHADRIFARAQAHPAPASDVAGALTWAGGLVGDGSGDDDGGGGWRGIALLSDAVSTAPPCTMPRPAPSGADGSVDRCFPDGPPPLEGTDVWFLGAGSYQHAGRQSVGAARLEAFWRSAVARGGGHMVAYGATVLGQTTSEEGNVHD
jgi:hypothetical protein